MSDYNREVECTYKGERYSVRDNGVVLRHPREDKRKRKYDNEWTFGKQNSNGYMRIGSEVVHRIVATAFHGEPPNPQYIVDHIDTNRRNNRPENLRWLSRLENTLNNPITRKKIEFLCGSVKAFLKDPSILKNHENEDPNFEWMRNVSSEEARNSLKRMSDWAKNNDDNSSSKKGALGEWIYGDYPSKSTNQKSSEPKPELDELVESKTPGAVQKNWKIPSEFPLCPSEISKTSLDQYLQNLNHREVFARNEYGESIVRSAGYSENSEDLLVLCNNTAGVKKWFLARISIDGQYFVHESIRSFLTLEGGQKQFTLGCGLKWEGGDSIDDYT